MTIITAVYEKGVFRPKGPVTFAEGTEVSMTVTEDSRQSDGDCFEEAYPPDYFSKLSGCLATDPIPELPRLA